MDVYKVVAISILTVILITILKSVKKDDFALIVTIIASLVIFSLVLIKAQYVIELLNNLINKAGINKTYLLILLKVTAIAYVIELATNICKDAGNSSLASKVEMFGKMSIVIITIPIITTIVSVITEIL